MRIISGYHSYIKKQEEKQVKTGGERAGKRAAPPPEARMPMEEGALFEYAERHDLLKGYGRYGQRMPCKNPAWPNNQEEEGVGEKTDPAAQEAAQEERGPEKNAADDKYSDIKQALEMLRERQVSSGNKQNIKDIAGALTRRLVASKSTMEVHQIAADALKELGELRMIAANATGDDAKKAWAVIKKLEKVVKRCNRKTGDLEKEDTMRRQQKRAEKAEMEQQAKEIARELKLKILRRKQREKKYLREIEEENKKNIDTNLPQEETSELSAVEEAHVEAQAEAQAAMEYGEPASMGSGGEIAGSGSETPAGGMTGGTMVGSQGEVSAGADAGGESVE